MSARGTPKGGSIAASALIAPLRYTSAAPESGRPTTSDNSHRASSQQWCVPSRSTTPLTGAAEQSSLVRESSSSKRNIIGEAPHRQLASAGLNNVKRPIPNEVADRIAHGPGFQAVDAMHSVPSSTSAPAVAPCSCDYTRAKKTSSSSCKTVRPEAASVTALNASGTCTGSIDANSRGVHEALMLLLVATALLIVLGVVGLNFSRHSDLYYNLFATAKQKPMLALLVLATSMCAIVQMAICVAEMIACIMVPQTQAFTRLP